MLGEGSCTATSHREQRGADGAEEKGYLLCLSGPRAFLNSLLVGFSSRGTRTIGNGVLGAEASSGVGSKGMLWQTEDICLPPRAPSPTGTEEGNKRLSVNRRVNDCQSHPLSRVGFCHPLPRKPLHKTVAEFIACLSCAALEPPPGLLPRSCQRRSPAVLIRGGKWDLISAPVTVFHC